MNKSRLALCQWSDPTAAKLKLSFVASPLKSPPIDLPTHSTRSSADLLDVSQSSVFISQTPSPPPFYTVLYNLCLSNFCLHVSRKSNVKTLGEKLAGSLLAVLRQCQLCISQLIKSSSRKNSHIKSTQFHVFIHSNYYNRDCVQANHRWPKCDPRTSYSGRNISLSTGRNLKQDQAHRGGGRSAAG